MLIIGSDLFEIPNGHLTIIEKDLLFYDESGGGVTFSGGEPLAQKGCWSLLQRLCDDGYEVSLETGGGLAASRGPGLQLTWQPTSQWRLALGGRYEKIRFRLDDKGAAPGGIGEDEAIPLYALAEYSWSDDLKLSLIGGAEVGGNLRLEDSSGNLVSESDMDTAPFVGLTFKGRF